MLKKYKPYLIHGGLFLATLFTTTMAGASWIGTAKMEDSFWDYFITGFPFSIPFLLILTVHEFGHYITARIYKVDVSLPYYIPFFIPVGIPQIGTFGAFIKMKNKINSRKEVFDIGVAGPLAGFFVALIVLTYGFTHLPEPEHIYKVHPDYAKFGINYSDSVYTAQYQKQVAKQNNIQVPENYEFTELSLGNNLVFAFFEEFVVTDKSLIPNKYEMFHYPFLFAAYLALFFTALNLIPIGQLDGGHVIYGLFGHRNHQTISSILFSIYVLVAGIGIFKNNLLEINFFETDSFNMLLLAAAYLYFLYTILFRTFKSWKNTLMIAVIIFSTQFFIEYFFPAVKGFDGWMFFAFIIGRFLGTDHPPATIEEPLDYKRKLIGWFTILVFIICFTPQVFVIETFK